MDLLNHFRQNNIKLGMVVDFTNTNRYYDGRVCKIKDKFSIDISKDISNFTSSTNRCKLLLLLATPLSRTDSSSR